MGHRPVSESLPAFPAFLAGVSRKLRHRRRHHPDKPPEDVGPRDGKTPPPSPVGRVLGKARAVAVFLYAAAKKKCSGVNDGERRMVPTAEYDQSGGGKPSTPPPSSPVRRAWVKARAVAVLAFLAVRKKLDDVRDKNRGEARKEEEAPEVDRETGGEGIGGGSTLPTPLSTPVRRALGKAREVVASPFHAAKKKARGKREEVPRQNEEEILAGERMNDTTGGQLSASQRQRSLGTVRAVVLYPFGSARRQNHATGAAAEDQEEMSIPPSETEQEAEHELSTSPGSMHSTSPPGTKSSSKATPTRSPRALLRKVQAAALLLPFHSRNKTGARRAGAEPEDDDEGLPPRKDGSLEGVVWKKSILMGQKCEPLDFPGVIYYDTKGERIEGMPPRSPRSAVQIQPGTPFTEPHLQHSQQAAFSFPVLVDGPHANDR